MPPSSTPRPSHSQPPAETPAEPTAHVPLLLLLQGKRFALANTRIMIHHPSGAARGQASDINREARELLRIRDYMDAILAEATGQPFDKVRTPVNPPGLGLALALFSAT
jgi:hypothetical protein